MNSQLDVLLVLPPMYQTGRIPDYNPKEPMGLMYISSALKKRGFSVKILDADVTALTLEETVKEILINKAIVIGISVMQRALPSVKILAEKIREKEVCSHVCCGGFTATLSAKNILENIPQIDSIVLGEGEDTFSDLVSLVVSKSEWQNIPGIAYKNDTEVFINRPSEKPEISELDWPSREILPICLGKTNYATILASRGCYGACTFCSNQSFERSSIGANWRGRDPSDVVDEIAELKIKYGISVIKFNDPNIFDPGKKGKQHVIDICNQIIERNLNPLHIMGFCRSNDISLEIAQLMKKAGFERILIGIESANPEIIKAFRKGETIETICQSIDIFRKVGIDIVPGFMIFNPYTTIKTLRNDLMFLEKYNLTPTLSKSLRVFDGTPIQYILEEQKRLIWRSPFEGYHEYIMDSNIAAIYMALKTVFVEWIDLLRKTYQDDLWGIKKASSFKDRKGFDKLSSLMFDLEKDMLESLMNWIEKGFSRKDVIDQLEKVKVFLHEMECYIVETSSIGSRINFENMSAISMSDKIYSILTNKIYYTFPEKYRWGND